jgi:Putative auto-transporter adhesin, head GIN domain
VAMILWHGLVRPVRWRDGMSRTRCARRSVPAILIVTLMTVASGLSLAACAVGDGGSTKIGSAPYERGSGTVATETRSLDAFHAVSASRGVAVSVSSGPSNAATVTADDNLLAHIATDVTGGELVITVNGSIDTRHPLEVEVSVASPVDAIAADAGASVDCEDLQPASLVVRATSGASVRAGGRATSLELTADTGSTVDLRNVEVAEAQVTVTTGSTAHVHATDAVRGMCMLGSTLRLHGTPATLAVDADTSSTVGE